MNPRRASRLGQRLPNVNAKARDRDAVAEAQARGVFEVRFAELVESIAEVGERGDAKVARQIADDFNRAGGKVASAVRLAFFIEWQLVQREAADAAFATGKETLRGRQI